MYSVGNNSTQINDGETPVKVQPQVPPAKLGGRFTVLSQLGEGGYGQVFLAHDEFLKRKVAVKLLRLRKQDPEQVDVFIAEAQMLAKMRHPGIVEIYDAAQSAEGECYIVSRFIEGQTLRARLQQNGFTHYEAAVLALRLCEALIHAHDCRVVHRDVKPANIMLTLEGSPLLLDFGLARDVFELGQSGISAGTPGYMSPEQARGEDHRVDERSDIFSLGLVFYELLTSQPALAASSAAIQLTRMAAGEPQAPHERVAELPAELSRICMKAMHQQLRWRYQKANEMADDLRLWLSQNEAAKLDSGESPAGPLQHRAPQSATAITQSLPRVVPRGLRAFDENDSEFFLSLVPGPRDRFGMPESLRFWKYHIESSDPQVAFRIGVIYGPSGCGKSSLLGAGLLPRCSDHVQILHMEARDSGNAARLARGLHTKFPSLDPANFSPSNLLHEVRTSGLLLESQKLLLVIDQVEQWLPACEYAGNQEGSALLDTLRQCDGVHVQALLLVRDDFWRGISRLMADVDMELMSSNSSLVDLFEPRHAERILECLGRAYECLPGAPHIPLSFEAKNFIRVAVENLSEGGKVSPVRLTLFTEMFRTRPWTKASLQSMGGVSGVAVRFLEETFCGSSAHGPRKVHEKAARLVLQSLVPPTGDMRGPAKTESDLVVASGYADKKHAFAELLNVLDSELRLLTPVDPDDTTEEERTWQLTHDHMVPALRQWLHARKADTIRGRAEIALASRSAEWAPSKDSNRLPKLFEWGHLRFHTRSSSWSDNERRWMQAGKRRAISLVCSVAGALLILGTAVAVIATRMREETRGLAMAENILTAEPSQVQLMIKGGETWKTWAVPRLQEALQNAIDSRPGFNARLALVSQQPELVQPLAASLLQAEAPAFAATLKGISTQPKQVPLAMFRQALTDASSTNGKKLRAYTAIAAFNPQEEMLKTEAGMAAVWLVSSVADLPAWSELVLPVKSLLAPCLEPMLASSKDVMLARNAATALTQLSRNSASELAQLAGKVPVTSLPGVVGVLCSHVDATEHLLSCLEAPPKNKDSLRLLSDDECRFFSIQSNTLLALVALGAEHPCMLRLGRTADRSLRTRLILNSFESGVPAETWVNRLLTEKDVGVRFALLLIMAQYPISELREPIQVKTLSYLRNAFANDPDGGVHSAIITLLKHWDLHSEWETLKKSIPKTIDPLPGFYWWITPSNIDMRVITFPGGRRVGIGACEISLSDYHQLVPQHESSIQSTDGTHVAETWPADSVSWLSAAEYCNSLSHKESMPKDEEFFSLVSGNLRPAEDNEERHGYRLPTEVEWKFAAAQSRRYRWDFGGDPSVASRFAWTNKNAGDHPQPVGTLLPNEFGLWDTMGNMNELTLGLKEVGLLTISTRMGGAFSEPLMLLGGSQKFSAGIDLAVSILGFRIARSLP